ncbi:MAG: DinB/UmuC family translesion DNA polymerase, partial [Sulfuricaulis sp.]
SHYGARTCGDVARLPLNVLARRYGVTGKYLWLACQGEDTEPVAPDMAPPQSIGHGKVLPPHTTVARVIEIYLRHMCEKVAARLRRYDMQAGQLYVGLRLETPHADIDQLFRLPYGPADGRYLFDLALELLRRRWRRVAVTHVQVTASRLRPVFGQFELFPAEDCRRTRRFGVIDRINRRYGEFTVAPATLLERSIMPNVIAPAWRPEGHRQHIPD